MPTNLQWQINWGPASAASAILLGTSQVDVPIPGLCTNLYVGGFFHSFSLSTNASGSASAPLISVPYNAGYVGVKLFAQAASIDPGQPFNLPVAVSRGSSATVPAMGVQPFPIVFIFATNATATTGGMSTGWGMATRWS